MLNMTKGETERFYRLVKAGLNHELQILVGIDVDSTKEQTILTLDLEFEGRPLGQTNHFSWEALFTYLEGALLVASHASLRGDR